MPELFRKRLIPEECIHLNKDRILFQSDNYIITGWDTINPKATFAKGLSLYLIDKGWKISKFFDSNNNFVYWYCDIIRTDYDAVKDSYTFTDLLADVIIYPDNSIRVVDLDEFEPALTNGLISAEEIVSALNQLNGLLQAIYSGKFLKYTELINKYEN